MKKLILASLFCISSTWGIAVTVPTVNLPGFIIPTPDGRLQYMINPSSLTIGNLGFGVQVLNGGVLQGGATWFNFTGSGCSASVAGGTATINCTGGGGGGGGSGGAIFFNGNAQSLSTAAYPGATITYSAGFATVTFIPAINSTYTVLTTTGISLSNLWTVTLSTYNNLDTQIASNAVSLSSLWTVTLSTYNNLDTQIASNAVSLASLWTVTLSTYNNLDTQIATTGVSLAQNWTSTLSTWTFFIGFTSTSDAQQTKFVNFRSTTDTAINSTGVAVSNLTTAFYAFTSTSDSQQTKFVNFRSTTDSALNSTGVAVSNLNTNFYAFTSTSDSQQTKFVNFRSTTDSVINSTGVSLSNYITINTTNTNLLSSSSTFTGQLIAGSSFSVTNGTTVLNGQSYIWPSTGAPAATDLTLHYKNGFLYFGGDAVGAGGTGGSDNLGSHVATNTVQMGFGFTASSGIVNSSFTARDVIVDTAGALLGATTIQGRLMVEGGTLSFRNQSSQSTFDLSFASAPTAGQHLFVTSVLGNTALIAGGGDNAGSGGGGGGGGTVATFDGTVTGAFSTMSVLTPFGIASVSNANSFSTMTVLSSTSPYRTISIPAGSWLGMNPSPASWTNGGVAIASANPVFNITGESFHEFRQSTPTYAMVSFRMPYEWDGSSIGVNVTCQASTGQANTNIAWAMSAVTLSSGSSAYQTITSSTEFVATWVSSNTEFISSQAAVNVQGTPAPGSRVKFILFNDPKDGKNTFNGIPRMTEVLISYRDAVWDGRPR